ncbi:MAG: hypothetical protein NWS64_02855, partial [Microbacteriaceae bacterium]|nr:hypothetical protein [Microbacteriaceae bacterium]
MSKLPVDTAEAVRFFHHIAEVFSGRKRRTAVVTADPIGSLAFENGRDPRTIGDLVGTAITDRGWAPFLARESVLE